MRIQYNKINYDEKVFIDEIISLAVHYPLMWYEFTQGILNDKDIVTIKDKMIIFNYSKMNASRKKVFEFVFSRIQKSKVIISKVNASEFEIINFESDLVLDILFKKYWLNYLLVYCLKDIFKEKIQACVHIDDEYFVDAIYVNDEKIICFECLESKNDKKINISNLNNVFKIVVYQNQEFIESNNDVKFVKYSSNYYLFKKRLYNAINSFNL